MRIYVLRFYGCELRNRGVTGLSDAEPSACRLPEEDEKGEDYESGYEA